MAKTWQKLLFKKPMKHKCQTAGDECNRKYSEKSDFSFFPTIHMCFVFYYQMLYLPTAAFSAYLCRTLLHKLGLLGVVA